MGGEASTRFTDRQDGAYRSTIFRNATSPKRTASRRHRANSFTSRRAWGVRLAPPRVEPPRVQQRYGVERGHVQVAVHHLADESCPGPPRGRPDNDAVRTIVGNGQSVAGHERDIGERLGGRLSGGLAVWLRPLAWRCGRGG